MGLYNICIDKTDNAMAMRRQEALRQLGVKTASCATVSQVFAQATSAIETLPLDLPLLMVYSVAEVLDNDQQLSLQLNATVGLPDSHPLAVSQISINLEGENTTSLWPMQQVLQNPNEVLHIRNFVPPGCEDLASRGWPEPFRDWAIVGVSLAGHLPRSILITALNPRTPLTSRYADFLISVARRLDSALMAAETKEADAKAMARLESLVQQRTREVQRHSLKLVEEQKERADEAIRARKEQEAFVDLVHHEIRNPISCIVQGVQLLNTCLENLQQMHNGLMTEFDDSFEDLQLFQARATLEECTTEGRSISEP